MRRILTTGALLLVLLTIAWNIPACGDDAPVPVDTTAAAPDSPIIPVDTSPSVPDAAPDAS